MATSNGSKLIFHIGHHKTGSTAIQHALATGRLRVAGQRILYTAPLNHNALRNQVDHFAKTGESLPGTTAAPNLDWEESKLAAGGFDAAVYSAEEFEGADPRNLKKALDRFFLQHVTDYRIVCYLRPHAGRTLSNFAEDVKLGVFQGTLEDYHASFVRSGRLNYTKRLAPWKDVFGEHFVLRPMVRGRLHGQSVLEDFARTAFGNEARLQIDEDMTNETLCLEDLAFVRRVQMHLQHRGRPLRHAMGWTLALASARTSRNRQTRLQIHLALAEKIRSRYLEDARELDRTFFAADPVMVRELDQTVDLACANPQSLAAADHFSVEELRRIEMLAGVIDMMLDNDKGKWPSFLRSKRVAALHETPSAPRHTASRPALKTSEMPSRKVPGSALIRRWSGFLRGTHIATALERGLAPPPVDTRPISVTSADSASWEVLDRALMHQLMSNREDDLDQLYKVSKWLNNLFITPAVTVRLRADELVDMLQTVDVAPGMRDVLGEFLVQLVFHHNARRLAGEQQQTPLEELARCDDGLGRTIRYMQTYNRAHAGPQLGMLQGGICYLQGALGAAYRQFDEARQTLLEGAVQRHHNGGLLSLRPLPTFTEWARSGSKPALPKMSFASDHRFGDHLPIVVVGVDRGYYDRYAGRLVETAKGRANLHFHVVNPDGMAILDQPHVRHSFETNPSANSAYYTVSRFLRLPELLDHYNRPLMTADADAMFVGPVEPLFTKLCGHDILMNAANSLDSSRGYLAAVPWRRVTAQAFVAMPTSGAAEFLAIYGRLYAGLTHGGLAPNWWIDQALLSATSDVVRHEGRTVRFEQRWLLREYGMVQSKI